MEDCPVIFLDIDGVLNGHDFDENAQSNTIDSHKVFILNAILKESGAKLVLSSAWRYMIHGGAMSLTGFEYLLRSHGIMAGRLIGATCSDECRFPVRGQQIADYRNRFIPESTRCVILDDGDARWESDYGLNGCGIPWVQTDSAIGLTWDDARKVLEILGHRA